MAALWSATFGPATVGPGGWARRRKVWRPVLILLSLALAGCSELAQSNDTSLPGNEPAYASLASKHLQAVLKDRATYDGFEISNARWVHSLRGWTWLTCVHFRDHGHLRSYAIFIQDNAVVEGRFAVETDACEIQAYAPFDLMKGELGHANTPMQPALY